MAEFLTARAGLLFTALFLISGNIQNVDSPCRTWPLAQQTRKNTIALQAHGNTLAKHSYWHKLHTEDLLLLKHRTSDMDLGFFVFLMWMLVVTAFVLFGLTRTYKDNKRMAKLLPGAEVDQRATQAVVGVLKGEVRALRARLGALDRL